MSGFVDVASGLPSRRTVIAAAAWSVPVIAVMTATPAFAASESVGLAVTGFQASKSTRLVISGNPLRLHLVLSRISGTLKVQVATQQPAVLVQSITVIISVPKAGMSSGKATVRSGSGYGWKAGSTSSTATTMSYSFLWTGTISSASTSRSTTLNFSLPGSSEVYKSSSFPKALIASANSPTATGAVAATTES